MKMVEVGEVAKALTGFPFDSSLFNDVSGFPLIRIRNLKQGKTDTLYNGEFDKSFLVKKGDLLIGMDGEFNIVEWQAEDALLNQRVMKLIPNEKLVLKQYLKYSLPKRLKEIEDATPFVTVKHLSHKKVLESRIPLPDIKTQQKVAHILEQADLARQKRKQANQLTEAFLQSVFLEMFGDPISNSKKFKVVTIGDFCEIRRGASPRPIDKFTGGSIPWIKISDATDEASSLYIYKTKVHVSKEGAEKSVFVPEGSLIFANCGVSLGFARILKTGGCIHDGWLSLFNFSKEIDVLFLLSWINQMTNYLRKLAPDGTQPNLNIAIMKNLKFPLPPLNLQSKYSSLVLQVEQLRVKQRESETELENLFNSLMQKYFG